MTKFCGEIDIATQDASVHFQIVLDLPVLLNLYPSY